MESSLYTNLVLFDGVCNLCNGFVQFLIRRDRQGRFSFGALQGNTARGLLPNSLAGTLYPPDSVVYLRHGILFTHSSAVLRILRDLGGFWRISIIFYILPNSLRNWLYRIIARHRYRWWGKRDACMVPAPAWRKRFVD